MVPAPASTAGHKYGDMLTISPRSTRSAQRSFWKLIDEAPEAVLSHPLHLRALRGLRGEYVTAILARSTSGRTSYLSNNSFAYPSTAC